MANKSKRAANVAPATESKLEFGRLKYMNVTFKDAPKLRRPDAPVIEAGDAGKCVHVYSKYGKETAIVLFDGNPVYVNPKLLKEGTPMTSAERQAYDKQREAVNSETLIMPVTVIRENPGKSVFLRYSGFAAPFSVAMQHVTILGEKADGPTMAELPAWVIRSKFGPDGVEVLRAKQDGYNKMVPAAG